MNTEPDLSSEVEALRIEFDRYIAMITPPELTITYRVVKR